LASTVFRRSAPLLDRCKLQLWTCLTALGPFCEHNLSQDVPYKNLACALVKTHASHISISPLQVTLQPLPRHLYAAFRLTGSNILSVLPSSTPARRRRIMVMHDAAGSQYEGTDSCFLATRRRECLPTPLGRNNSVRHNTTTNTTITTATSSGLLRSMARGRRRSGDNEPATFSLAGERMMSAEEYGALPRSIQYVTCFLFILRLEPTRLSRAVLCLLFQVSTVLLLFTTACMIKASRHLSHACLLKHHQSSLPHPCRDVGICAGSFWRKAATSQQQS
jgi:hypothetical protein